jgi:hypothetical protein
MPSAIAGSLSCARCSLLLTASERFCTRCGAPQVPAAAGGALVTGAGLLAGVAQATATRRRTAALVDVAVAVLPAVAVVAASVTAADGGTATTVGAVLAGVGVVVLVGAALFVAVTRRGRSVGLLVTRCRRVDLLTALPPHLGTALRGALAPWSPHATLTADLRRGRDPLDPALHPLGPEDLGPVVVPRAPASPPGAPEGRRAARAARRAAPGSGADGDRTPLADVRLVPTTGDVVVVGGTVLVGRKPETPDPGVVVHALPDIARTLSRNHALLEWADGLLWVTDLHTTNGTTVTAPDGAVQPLVPGQRTATAIGWHVELGERDYTVTAGDPA